MWPVCSQASISLLKPCFACRERSKGPGKPPETTADHSSEQGAHPVSQTVPLLLLPSERDAQLGGTRLSKRTSPI